MTDRTQHDQVCQLFKRSSNPDFYVTLPRFLILNDWNSHGWSQIELTRPLVCGHSPEPHLWRQASFTARLLESPCGSPARPHCSVQGPSASAQDILPTVQIFSLLGLKLLDAKAWGQYQLSAPSYPFHQDNKPRWESLEVGKRKGKILEENNID